MEATRKDSKLAILLPTRGLVNSRTMESVLKNLEGKDYTFLFTHDLPLPDCRNTLVERFLDSDAEYAWWLDDDVVIPGGFLDEMLKTPKDTIALGTYYMQNGKTSTYYKDGIPTQGGFGCALIHRTIHENTPKPWFASDIALIIQNGAESWVKDERKTWGGEDTWFFRQSKAPIRDVGMVGHLRIKSWGDKYLNKGCHEIYLLDESGEK